jgi:type II secretory pathway pseudopilin PulG
MGKIKNQGYTLIELITVSGIMVLFSLTLISVFLATVRSGTKTQAIQQVHQNGDFALKTMARMIRVADEVENCGASITLLNPDNGQTIFSLVEDSEVLRVASNSAEYLTGISIQASDLSFTCYVGSLGEQVVTIEFVLSTGQEEGSQAQETLSQEFATSISTRQ